MKVTLLPQAQADLDQIVDPLYTRIIKRLRLLGRFPELGAAMTGPFAGYRSTVVGLFRIVYRVLDAKTVQVAYVRHCQRPPPA